MQGLPNMGSNAGAGTLDFLRSSQQVLIFLSAYILLITFSMRFPEFLFTPLFIQFQALRAMVQANPQILQVPVMSFL